MRKSLLLSLALLLGVTAARADEYPYAALYEGLPFDMPRVERPVFPDRRVSLADYAEPLPAVKCTEAFQRAIDELSAAGGGTLTVPAGLWYTGPVELRSDINLHLEYGSLILFSEDIDDYPIVDTTWEGQEARRAQSPITALGATNIAITGHGIIDGNGEAWRPLKREKVTESTWQRITGHGGHFRRATLWQPREEELPRPVMVNLYGCKGVLLEGVTFQNSPAWNLHPECCDNVIIDGVSVRNPSYAQNGDGLDLESCTNCIVTGTTFDVGDDAICIKSGKNEFGLRRGRPTENVIIQGCTVYAGHGGFVIGSEMSGGVRNLRCSDCQFIGTDVGLRFKSCRGRGGVVENIWVDHIVMVNILGDAIRFNLYYGGKFSFETLDDGSRRPMPIEPQPIAVTTPSFRSIHLSDIVCKGAERALYFNGLPEMPVKDITLDRVDITAAHAGELIYCRNVKFEDVQISAPDSLQRFFCQD